MERVRRAAHAGSWYTDNPTKLGEELDGWLRACGLAKSSDIRGVIAPHAGYSYSGRAAAFAFANIDPENISRVFLLGPSHHYYTPKCALSRATVYKTPLGDLPIDLEVNEELRATGKFELMDLHVDEAEHSMEMHLPYLAKVFHGWPVKIVPILVGALNSENEAMYGRLLAKYVDDPKNFFSVSSDFCHWGSRFNYTYYDKKHGPIYKSIEALDRMGMEIIETGDADVFKRYLSEFDNTICGRHPISVFLHMLRNCSTNVKINFLRYEQSSQCTGPPPPPAYGFHMLERRTIVLADGSVRSYFALPPDHPIDPAADRFFPYGPHGPGHGIEPDGPAFGFDRNYPPHGHFSPDAFRREREREELFGRGGRHDFWHPLDGRGGPPRPEFSLKRKYGEEEGRDGREEFVRQRQQQLLQYGNPNPNGFPGGDRLGSPPRWDPLEPGRRGQEDLRPSKNLRSGPEGYGDLPPPSRPGASGGDMASGAEVKYVDVDLKDLKKAFLHCAKLLNENILQKKNFLDDGKSGVLRCLICDRDSKEYTDVHGVLMHAYNSQKARVEHLGFHKALCVLMGWNYTRVPDNSKAYQLLSEDEAAANKEDLIIWPPIVLIHNTNTGKQKDGRMDGVGNKEMDTELRELGFGGGKARSLYGKDGHMGITVVKFENNENGLEGAEHLAEYFEKDNRGRKSWARVQTSQSGVDDESNPYLVKVDVKTGAKKRIYYGYLGSAFDLDKVDFDTRKRAQIKSKRESDVLS